MSIRASVDMPSGFIRLDTRIVDDDSHEQLQLLLGRHLRQNLLRFLEFGFDAEYLGLLRTTLAAAK